MLAEVADIAQDNDLDRGATSVAPGTERTCALSRKLKPVSELIRFVSAAGEAVPDIKRKLPGAASGSTPPGRRSRRRSSATYSPAFQARCEGRRDLADQTERLLESAALDALSIAGKAGLVTGGFAKVEAALDHNGVLALIHASDAAADGKRKLDGALHRNRDEKRQEIAVIEIFSGRQLDLALNRQMWYMQPCLPAPGVRLFSLASRA